MGRWNRRVVEIAMVVALLFLMAATEAAAKGPYRRTGDNMVGPVSSYMDR